MFVSACACGAEIGENVAAGKPYSLQPAPNYPLCTDPGDKTQITDGQYTEGYFWTQPAKVIRAAQPEVVLREDPTWRDPAQALPEVCDVLCPNTVHWIDKGRTFADFYLGQQKAGRELWFYSCSNPGKRLDPYAYQRMQHWFCFQHDAKYVTAWNSVRSPVPPSPISPRPASCSPQRLNVSPRSWTIPGRSTGTKTRTVLSRTRYGLRCWKCSCGSVPPIEIQLPPFHQGAVEGFLHAPLWLVEGSSCMIVVRMCQQTILDIPGMQAPVVHIGEIWRHANVRDESGKFALLFYAPMEATMAAWATTYLGDKGLSQGRATAVLSGFWPAFTCSRLATALLVANFPLPAGGDTLLIVVLSILCVLIWAGAIFSPGRGTAAAAVVLAGLVFGPTFPTIIGVLMGHVSTNLSPELGGRAVGLLFMIGGIGWSVIPILIGAYARKSGIQKGFLVAVGAAVGLAVIAILLHFTLADGLA